ncbi:MAG TPA: antibiotic ABC transporter ATP-binding protein [Microscillaceae bacterium]|nr:antibiotic ABC transporter ATP-binding protein [Microscillaceae bacterium]
MSDSSIQNDVKITSLRTLKRLVQFVRPYKKRFFILLTLALLTSFLRPAQPYLIQIAIDRYIFTGNYAGLLNVCGWMLAVLALQTYFTYAHTYLAEWLGQTIIRDIRVQLFAHTLKLRLKFYDRTPLGHLITRNISDVQTLSSILSSGIAAMIADTLFLIIILTLMLSTHWPLTLVSLSLMPLLIWSSFIFKKVMKKEIYAVRNAVSNLNAFVQEHITGIYIIQLFGIQKQAKGKFKAINKEHRTAYLKTELYQAVYHPLTEVLTAAGLGFLVWFGARSVLKDEISLGVLVAFMMYIRMFYGPIRNLAERLNVLQLGAISMQKIFILMENPATTPDQGKMAPTKIQGHIKFQHIWLSYTENEYVLKDISFEVVAGQTVALVGATGAGKTSIINMLNRFYAPTRGNIYLDALPIQEYHLGFLRRQIGVVLQDVFLFAESLRENITLGDHRIRDDQIWQIIDWLGARAFIEKLPGGLDYNVQERGATLSVGQRQLISFARVLLFDPKIIVLDEATSSIDSDTELLVQTALEKLMKGRTAIVIAHRLATIQKADNIIVLDKGEIKEQGHHQMLLDKKGWYAELHQMSFKM